MKFFLILCVCLSLSSCFAASKKKSLEIVIINNSSTNYDGVMFKLSGSKKYTHEGFFGRGGGESSSAGIISQGFPDWIVLSYFTKKTKRTEMKLITKGKGVKTEFNDRKYIITITDSGITVK